MDANILHRIKQEPVEYNETPEITCVTFQQNFNDNSFQEMFVSKYAPADEANESPAVPRVPVNQESIRDDESHELEAADSHEVASAFTDITGLRRSSRQRFTVQRLSTQQKEKPPTSYQRQSPSAQSVTNARVPFSGVRRRGASNASQRAFPNRSIGVRSFGETETSEIINDANDLFKRRFRKVRCQGSRQSDTSRRKEHFNDQTSRCRIYNSRDESRSTMFVRLADSQVPLLVQITEAVVPKLPLPSALI